MANLSLKKALSLLLNDASERGRYGFVKAPTAFNLDATTTTRSLTVTINATGRPVVLICSGDLNPGATESTWFTLKFYRGTTYLASQIDQSNTMSLNSPFCLAYIDVPSAGTVTYEARFDRGAGTCQMSESGEIQSPNFLVFEI